MADRGTGPIDEVRAVLASQVPDYRVDSVRHLGAGTDNVAYDVNGELVVRFGRTADPAERAARVTRDRRLLELADRLSPLPVPRPLFSVAELGCLAYRRLPGVPLLDLAPTRRAELAEPVAAVLGTFLAALHAAPVDRLDKVAQPEPVALAAWRDEAAESWPALAHAVPAGHRGAVARFLAEPLPPEEQRLVFSHNDLGIEHVLVDPASGQLTGVIDWSDAALVDPAHDFGLLLRDLGPAALEIALCSCRADPNELAGLRARALVHARCGLLADLAHGLETGDRRYVDKSRDGLGWLFPLTPEAAHAG